MVKKDDYLSKIDKIPTVSFNKEQKIIAKKILEKTDEKDLDAVYGLITQRVKTGFVFDEAPEVNHNAVSIVKENKNLKIDGDSLDCIEHKLIIGENYDALKNLCATYIDKNGKGLIDVIYIDPPYNTEATKQEGNDYKQEIEATKFIYRDKFTRDGWLNMMNERLKLAKQLLSESGVIFISIDDSEQAYLKVLCDEIFGEENFIASIVWECRNPNVNIISTDHEYCLVYAKDKSQINPIYKKKEPYNWYGRPIERNYDEYNNRYLAKATVTPKQAHYTYYIEPILDDSYNGYSSVKVIETDYNIIDNLDTQKYIGHKYYAEAPDTAREKFNKKKYRIVRSKDGSLKIQEIINKKDDTFSSALVSVIHRKEIKYDDSNKDLQNLNITGFNYAKPVKYIKNFIKAVYGKNVIVLDFFAGSGTTGQAVMELNAEDGGNRQFILVTNNENKIGEKITRERLYRVIKGIGTNGETFDWTYKKDTPYLNKNSVRVFNIETYELTLNDLDKAEDLKEKVKLEFKKLNQNYSINNDFDIYNELSALNPQKLDKDCK